MKRLLPLLLLSLCGTPADTHAQLAFGGHPLGPEPSIGLPEAPLVTMPAVDVGALMAEDAAALAAGIKGRWRFGVPHDTDIDAAEAGTWHALPSGDRVWRVRLRCPGAVSVSVIFTEYLVPVGGRVFLYTPSGEVLGGFTARSNPGGTKLGVAPVEGDEVTVEYVEPAAVAGQGRLTIGRVVHGYRSLRQAARGFGDSGECNINVICPEGDDWRDQIRSAVHIIGNGGVCSGTLLNNCEQDSTPYFLTADHCKPSGEDPATWVFRFNWDSPSCDPTEQGPMDQTISGSDELVNNPGTDMLFLRLSSIPPVTFNVYYSGWDHGTAPATRSTGIHHPSGDIKKISHSEVGVVAADDMDMGSGPADCWQVPVWNAGTTEPGSSGSGLWNQHKQVIGQLYGGSANCANSVNDYYGRLSESWPLLEEWLGTCGDTLGGFDPNALPVLVRDASITSINGLPVNSCDVDSVSPVVTLKNQGDEALNSVVVEYLVGTDLMGTITWSGNLLPQQTANVQLPGFPVPTGVQSITVRSADPNGLFDFHPENDAHTADVVLNHPGSQVRLEIIPDDFAGEITWTLGPVGGPVLHSGGPYQDGVTTPIISDFCLGNGCYEFIIHDEFGDGICCQEGDGSLSITSFAGTHVSSNGQYGDGFSQSFCLTTASVHEVSGPRFTLQPNPAHTQVLLIWADVPGTQARWQLHDAAGRMVLQGGAQGQQRTVIALDQLEPGVYIMRAIDGTRRSAQRLVLQH